MFAHPHIHAQRAEPAVSADRMTACAAMRHEIGDTMQHEWSSEGMIAQVDAGESALDRRHARRVRIRLSQPIRVSRLHAAAEPRCASALRADRHHRGDEARQQPAFSGLSPKARYAAIDAARWAQRYGIPFEINQAFLAALRTRAFDYQILTRGALVADELGAFARYNEPMFAAIWGKPQDVVTEDGREAFLQRLGIDAPHFWRRAQSAAVRVELERRNEIAAQRGVFGVPTFFIANEIFFGNDRLNFVRERVAAESGDTRARLRR